MVDLESEGPRIVSSLKTKVWRFVPDMAKWHEGIRGSLSMMAWKRSFEKVTHLKYDNVWTWIFQSGVKFVPLNHQNQTWGLKFDIWLEGLGTYTRVIPINFNELDRGVPGKSTMIGSMVLDHHFFVPFDAEKATKNMTHTIGSAGHSEKRLCFEENLVRRI